MYIVHVHHDKRIIHAHLRFIHTPEVPWTEFVVFYAYCQFYLTTTGCPIHLHIKEEMK